MSKLQAKLKPHVSHKMTRWTDTIVTLIATPRFGRIRECKNCGGEHAQTVCGEQMHHELYKRCIAAPTKKDNQR